MGPQVQRTPPNDPLDRWKKLTFNFDADTPMDPPPPPQQPPHGSRNRNPQDELTDAALLAQLAELARMSQQDSNTNYEAYSRAYQGMQNPHYPSHAYPQLHGYPQHLPSVSQAHTNDLWAQLAALGQHHLRNHPHAPHQAPAPAFHTYDHHHQPPQTQPLPPVASTSTAASSTAAPVSPAGTSSTGPNSPVGGAEAEVFSTLEDKRRRNTEASARFRIKKKQKALNLQRSVADLTGRAEELEKEAAELRRENGWLKEIIMLKSNRLTDIAKTVEAYQVTGTSASGSSSSTSKREKSIEEEPQEEDTGDDSDYEEAGSGKGKGKQKAKPTKRRKK